MKHGKVVAEIGELSIPILAVDDLIENKLSTGRDKDVIDANKGKLIISDFSLISLCSLFRFRM